MKHQKAFSILLAIMGILLFSSKAVMVKLAYQYEINSVSLLLLRMLFSLPFYITIAFIQKPKEKTTTKDYLWVIGLGVIGYYLASYFDFLGLQFIKASLERLILFVYPTLVLLLSYVLFGTRITRKQIAGVAITYLGIVVIFSSELMLTNESHVLIGAALIFLSALTYASYLVGSGWLIPKFGATVFTSYAMIVSCLCVIIHYSLSSTTGLLDFPPEIYWIAGAMAIFATVIPSYLISFAIKGLGANNFSLFGSLGPVSTLLLAYIFLDESLTWIQLVGAMVVIGGIFLAEKKRKTA